MIGSETREQEFALAPGMAEAVAMGHLGID